MIHFDVAGIPVAQGSKTVGRSANGAPFVRDTAKGLKDWRQLVAWSAQEAVGINAPWLFARTPLRVGVVFRMPVPKSAPKRRRLPATKKPDLDKLLRAILDALTGVLYHDDSQVVEALVRKELAYDAAPGVSVSVSEAVSNCCGAACCVSVAEGGSPETCEVCAKGHS
jgi:Holliday junction resolvase RusA-like endonuclease